MPSLAEAYIRLSSTLKPQKQGTCGLYSFWFATLLLNELQSGGRPPVYPRSGEGAGTTESMRKFSKGIGSGQGEVLTCSEMEQIISHFGYACESHTSESGRPEFITRSLRANRPVLFPYIMGNFGPISSLNPKYQAGVDYGPHWSLIIDEWGDLYSYIEPNRPNKPTYVLKRKVLASNSASDQYKYERYWLKEGFTFQSTKPPFPKKSPDPLQGNKMKTKYYDIGDKSRQKLANVLIAVV